MSPTSTIIDGLLTLLWQSTLLFVLVAAACRLLRDSSPRMRHALWLIVLARLLVPALPVADGGSLALAPLGWATNPLRPVTASTPTEPAASAGAIESTAAGEIVVHAEALPATFQSSAPWLAGLWLAGIGTMIALLVVQLSRLRRTVARSRPAPDAVQRRADPIARKLGLRPAAPVRVSDDVDGPVTVGLRRPTVLLPSRLTEQLTDGEADGVLAHELAHVARRDLWVHALATVPRVLLFFHPVSWMTFRRIERERELVADGEAVRASGLDPVAYGRTLMKVAGLTRRPATAQPLAAALTANGRRLAERLRQLRELRPRRRGAARGAGSWPVLTTSLLAVVLVAQGCLAPSTPSAGSETEPPELAQFLLTECEARGIELVTTARSTDVPQANEVRAVVLVRADRDDPEVIPHVVAGGWQTVAAPPPVIRESLSGGAPHALELRVDGDHELDGEPGLDLPAVHAQLRRLAARSLTFVAPPQAPFEQVAETIGAARSVEGLDVVYGGIPIDAARARRLSELLSVLPDGERGEILVLTDRRASWGRHLEVLRMLAEGGETRIAFGARDAAGRLVRVRQDIPVDVGVSTR